MTKAFTFLKRLRVLAMGVLLLSLQMHLRVYGQSKILNGPTDPKELEKFLDNLFREEMEKQHVPGAVFVFVKDGKVFFSKGYGFSNVERAQRVVPEKTIFRIGSISKVFTATAVVQLADRRRLSLHADVNQYLRKLKVPGTYPQPKSDFKARAETFVGTYRWNIYCETCGPRPAGPSLKVTSNADGTLTINGRRWIETTPLFFVRDDGRSKLAFRKDSSGRIAHLFAGGFWVFERVEGR